MKVLAAELLAVAAKAEDFPQLPLPELALLGRSNVGKSSLLNRLVKRRQLARTSASPGKTRLVHLLSDRAAGARAVSRRSAGLRLGAGLEGGARRLEGARRVVPSAAGSTCAVPSCYRTCGATGARTRRCSCAWLAERRVPVLIAFTKADKLGAAERGRRVRALAASAGVPAERCIVTSAKSGEGIETLWRAIDTIL